MENVGNFQAKMQATPGFGRVIKAINVHRAERERKKSRSKSEGNLLRPTHNKDKSKQQTTTLRVSPILQTTNTEDFEIECCRWDTQNADLYLGVGKRLFPVHRSLVALASPVLRGIIVAVGHYDEMATVISIGDQQVDDIRLLLKFIYFPRKPIEDKLLDKCLYLADEFELPDLKEKCEDFLLLSAKMAAEEQFSFAVKHGLPRLTEAAVLRIHNGNETAKRQTFQFPNSDSRRKQSH
eukprot:Seg3528.4 transcript_id=Seg3528.4/GoldUCD/mRNA.D3Y31 product="BTB and MATH domain-containing protein 38" protein_id=Seg3528.4/GoldUCD/D3Y31